MARVIVPTYFPGLLTSVRGEAGLSKFEGIVREDLLKASRLTRAPSSWDERVIWETDSVGRPWRLFPSIDEVSSFVGPLVRWGLEGRAPVLTFDVETAGEHQLQCRLLCIGFGYFDPDTGKVNLLNVPMMKPGGSPYWAPHDEDVIRGYLRYLLTNHQIPKSAHNGAFDTVVMWAQGIPVEAWVHDTMQAHHVLDAELPQNLGFVGSRYTDNKFWKDDVKGGVGWIDIDATTLRSYNLRDVLVTMQVRPKLIQALAAEQLLPTYENEILCQRIMARATIRGVAVDFERRDSTAIDPKTGRPVGLAPRLELQMSTALGQLRAIGGSSFDPMKPAQLRWLLFDKLALPVVKETKSGLPATDKEAAMLLDTVSDTDEQKVALKALSKFRQAQKFLSTFVSGLEILRDGRFHPSWKMLTVSGRFASSPNFQNLPPAIKRIFRSPPGWKLVGIDLSQAELRLIAYYTGERELLRMYQQDINVHTVNSTLLFKVRCPPEAKDNTNAQTDAYLRHRIGPAFDTYPVVPKEKWKPVRTLAKNFQFGASYGAVDETLYTVLRSKRDPETSELLFPTLTMAEVQATRVVWGRNHPFITSWWQKIQAATTKAGKFSCPISGRIRRFRAGFAMNECVNFPIQTGIASWMNKNLVEIQDQYDRETGGAAQVVQQVHDALTVECPDDYAERAGKVMQDLLSRPFDITPHPVFAGVINAVSQARLPADAPMINTFLDKT